MIRKLLSLALICSLGAVTLKASDPVLKKAKLNRKERSVLRQQVLSAAIDRKESELAELYNKAADFRMHLENYKKAEPTALNNEYIDLYESLLNSLDEPIDKLKNEIDSLRDRLDKTFAITHNVRWDQSLF